MEYITVPYTTYLPQTLRLLEEPGLFLVSAGRDGAVNAMTIGWGTVGVIWGKPIFVVLVRPSRYTYSLLEANPSFTVCVPDRSMSDAVAYCGKYSGRSTDKLAACKLQTLPSTSIGVPGIAGCPVIYECTVVHTNDIIPDNLTPQIKADAYPRGNYHRLYYGEILAVRALANAAQALG